MSDDTDRFWEELRKQASDPKGFTALTDEEAERRMAEAGEEPMSAEEIADIVRSATAQGPQGVVDRDIEKPQARYLLKAAAAVVLTVALVAAVVTTKPWGAGDWQRTIEYRVAIRIALDGREKENSRNESLRTVFLSTRAGIRCLKYVREEADELREAADDALRMLRQTVKGPAVFGEHDRSSLEKLKQPVKESVAFIQDATNSLDDRVCRQRELGDQLRLGILALKKVHATEKANGLLWVSANKLLSVLRRQLEQ